MTNIIYSKMMPDEEKISINVTLMFFMSPTMSFRNFFEHFFLFFLSF